MKSYLIVFFQILQISLSFNLNIKKISNIVFKDGFMNNKLFSTLSKDTLQKKTEKNDLKILSEQTNWSPIPYDKLVIGSHLI